MFEQPATLATSFVEMVVNAQTDETSQSVALVVRLHEALVQLAGLLVVAHECVVTDLMLNAPAWFVLLVTQA